MQPEWTNRLRRMYKRRESSMKLCVFPRPLIPHKVRQGPRPPSRRYSNRLGQFITPYHSPSQMSLNINPMSSSSFDFPWTSTSTSSTATPTRKLTKKMPNVKKLPKGSTQSLVIGSPINFKKGSSATNLLQNLGVSTLGGGDDGYGGALSRPGLPDDDDMSLISMVTVLKEGPPLATPRANPLPIPLGTPLATPLGTPLATPLAPPLAHRHTAPPKMSLPNPLRSNPPETRDPIDPAPIPTHAVELDGNAIQTPANSELNDHENGCDEELNSAPTRQSVIYGSLKFGTPFFPIVEQVEDIQLPDSQSYSSSGQPSLTTEQQIQHQAKSANHPRSSGLPAVGPLPLEMREPLKIWQNYMKTGLIKVDICPEAIDSEGRYTWMHCWGLFSVYTFGASFMNDTEFADRTMDMLCEKIKPGHAADADTITLIFTGRNISSRLKRLVVDRCVDAGEKDLQRSITRGLPQEFAVYALEAAMKRLAYSDCGHASQSPCRYHRHRYPKDCYLRKFANERDRRVVQNRKSRKSQTSTQISFDLHTIKSEHSASDGAQVGESAVTAASNGDSNSPPVSDHGDRENVRGAPQDTDTGSIMSVQESELDTSESSVIAALGLNEGASIARACNIIKSSGRATIVGTPSTTPPDMDRSALEAVKDRDQALQSFSNAIQRSLSLDRLPGSYPESVFGH